MREVKVKPVFKHVRAHMNFVINMDGKFTRKSRLVVGGRKMSPPSSITYSSFVSREIVRL